MKHRYTQSQAIAAIQSRHRRGLSLSTVWKDDVALYVGASACFGTWRAALQAAGFVCARRQWNPQIVLAAMRERQRRQLPLTGVQSDDRFLFAAACRHFGGWTKAMAAAGLSAERLRKWTPARVLAAIHAWQEHGKPLSTIWKENVSLQAIAKRFFGTWRNALRAAGVPVPDLWTKEKLIAAIQQRHAEGLPLTAEWKECRSLYWSAKRLFGGWGRALRAAGLPATRRMRWTPALVIAAIRAHRRDGASLSHIWREDKTLFTAACRRFGNWHNALTAAGFQPNRRRRWSRERVLEELGAWRDRPAVNIRVVDPALAGAARRFFGSLEAAQEAVGIEPVCRRWLPARVIAAIQDRYGRGQPIHYVGFGDLRLATAAKRRFGSWANAVAAAGLASKLSDPKPVRTWTKQGVVEAIRGQHQQGLGTQAIWKRDTGLYSAAKKHFGTWRAAVTAAGFEPAHQSWTPDRIVREIQAWHQSGVRVSSISSQNPRLTVAAIRIFGGWHDALAAAGIHIQKKHRTKRGRACHEKL